jgi:hypothetical protein
MSPDLAQGSLLLSRGSRPESIPINGRCAMRTESGWRAISVGVLVVHHYPVGDRVAEAYSIVCLVNAGYAKEVEIARVFGCGNAANQGWLRPDVNGHKARASIIGVR